jgi:hypothetical protein
MADEAEDVLELEDELEIEDEPQEPDDEAAEPDEDEEGEETFIGFEGEEYEAAPASESDNSVIRDLRRANRDQARRIAELERGKQPETINVGPEPTLEGCEYDEDKFKAEWKAWNERNAKAEAQKREVEEADKRRQEEWQTKVQSYEADKTSLGVEGYDEAEAEVFSALSNETQALILMTEKPAALVYALHRSPAKLEELSKLNLAQAALKLGEWKGQLKMTKRAKPAPDRDIRGKTPASSGNLERLRAKAQKTGDYSEYFAAKRAAGL